MRTNYCLMAAVAAILFAAESLAQSMFIVRDQALERESIPVEEVTSGAASAELASAAARRAAAAVRADRMALGRPLILDLDQNPIRQHLQSLGWKNYGQPAPEEKLRIPVAVDQEVTLKELRYYRTGRDSVALVGSTSDSERESYILYSGDDVLGGEIYRNGRAYELRPIPGGDPNDYTITEVCDWTFVDEGPEHPIATRSRGFWRNVRELFGWTGRGENRPTTATVESDDKDDEDVAGRNAPPKSADGDSGAANIAFERDTEHVGTEISVMVLYPESLKDKVLYGAIGAEIRAVIDRVNWGYKSSGIDVVLELAYHGPVDYKPTGDAVKDLKALVKGDIQIIDEGADGPVSYTPTGDTEEDLEVLDDGGPQTVKDKWREVNADIASLWVDQSNRAGVGYTMTDVRPEFAPCAANVVLWPDAKKNFTFAHELGHNMGARHDKQQTPGNKPFDYAHGFVSKQHRLVTIMAYPIGSCKYRRCLRVNRFSSGEGDWGRAASADNARTLNETRSVVAAFDTQSHLLGGCNDDD